MENNNQNSNLDNHQLRSLFFTNKRSLQDATIFDQQIKASHNSFDKGPLYKQLSYEKEFPAFGGCLSIEFDLVQNHNLLGKDDEWEFYLQHGKNYNKNSQKFTEALAEVKQWAVKNPNHPPIVIYLDIKTEMCYGDPVIQTEKLDGQILKYINTKQLYRPNDMLKHEKNIVTYIKKHGYPKVQDLLNKFIFVMTGSEKDKKTHAFRTVYYTHNYKERIAFLDLDARIFPVQALIDLSSKEEIKLKDKKLEKFLENRFIYNVPVKQDNWEKVIKEAKQKGYLTRIFQANNEKDWKKACRAGVHHIATDKIFDVNWTIFK